MVKKNQIFMLSSILLCLVFFLTWSIACNNDDDDDEYRGDSDIDGGASSPSGDGSSDDDDSDDDDSDDDDDCDDDCYETADCVEMATYTYNCGVVFEDADGNEMTVDELQLMCAEGYNAVLGCAVYCWQDSLDADCTEYADCLATNCT